MLSNIFTQNVGLLMYCFLPLRKMEGNSMSEGIPGLFVLYRQ